MTLAGVDVDPSERAAQPKRSSRVLWMDLVRGVAILAVITFHSTTMPGRYGFDANDYWRYINETFALFRMPILVFLSGMLLPKSLIKSGQQYYTGKVRGILWPLMVWSTVYGAVTGVDFSSLENVIALYTGDSYLWFLFFIFIYYLAAMPLRRVNPLTISAIAFALSIASPDGDKYTERMLFLMALFFLGAFVAIHGERLSKILASRGVWLLAPLVAGSAMATVAFDLRYGPDLVVISLAGALLFAALAQRAGDKGLSRILIWIGQRSIVFYVSHAIFTLIVAQILSSAGVSSYAVAAAGSVSLCLIGGWALAVGTEKFPSVAWLFSFPTSRPKGQPAKLV